MSRNKRLLPDGLTFLSAVLIVAAFPPWNLSFLIWVALVPWLFALSRCSDVGRAIIQGMWLSVFMSVLGFPWVAYVLHQFAVLPWAVAVLGLLIYSLFGQLQFWVFGGVFRRIAVRERTPSVSAATGLALVLGIFYAGIDWVIPKLFKDTLGHSFYASPWLRQAADLGGAHLITFVIYLVNHALFEVIRNLRALTPTEPRWNAIRRSWSTVAIAFVAWALLIGYGAIRSEQIARFIASPKTTIQGAVIQANIGDFDKIAAESGLKNAAENVLATYFTQTDKALSLAPKPDFVVWPETAYPSTFRNPATADDLSRDQRIESFVRNRGFPLLFGGYDRNNEKDFNAFFLLSPTNGFSRFDGSVLNPGGDLQVYRKNILLLFGEYVPGTERLPVFRKYFPQVANFGRGVGPEVLKIPAREPIRIGPIICYEALFPEYVVGAARKGSQMILNITNDSWFGPYAEPELHLALTVFRSIETRLPQLRATNTGISTLILPTGDMPYRTGIFKQEIMNVTIPITEIPATLFVRWGDWFGLFAFYSGLILVIGIWMTDAFRKKAPA